MDLEEVRKLLRDPRSLTREQWNKAYLTIQEHNIRRGGRPGPVSDDDEEDDFTVDE
jgi:hypothetical protein